MRKILLTILMAGSWSDELYTSSSWAGWLVRSKQISKTLPKMRELRWQVNFGEGRANQHGLNNVRVRMCSCLVSTCSCSSVLATSKSESIQLSSRSPSLTTTESFPFCHDGNFNFTFHSCQPYLVTSLLTYLPRPHQASILAQIKIQSELQLQLLRLEPS